MEVAHLHRNDAELAAQWQQDSPPLHASNATLLADNSGVLLKARDAHMPLMLRSTGILPGGFWRSLFELLFKSLVITQKLFRKNPILLPSEAGSRSITTIHSSCG